MKSRLLMVVLAFSLGMACAPGVLADITPVNFPNPIPAGTRVSGVVVNVDPVNRQIQIRQASGMVETVHVDDQIEITRNGQTIRFYDVSLGDNVVVTAIR